jgi:fucose permease
MSRARLKPQRLPCASVASLFAAFAVAYFLWALLRAVTATLAPVFSSELALGAADLGLLAGAFFLGFRRFSCRSDRHWTDSGRDAR